MPSARSTRRALLGLGSNLGDREGNLERALELLGSVEGVHISQRSTWHETAPVGGPLGQGDYLNGACELTTTRSPEELLHRCQEIEAELGRVRTELNGPRTIDLDLLWYEGELRDEPSLTLPHPRWEERAFVLAPLAELVPLQLLPVCGETVAARASALMTAEVVA
jgi:2-amino-4-hydroxy-6-hydroxymethyldihydropteridine diphosphokinase